MVRPLTLVRLVHHHCLVHEASADLAAEVRGIDGHRSNLLALAVENLHGEGAGDLFGVRGSHRRGSFVRPDKKGTGPSGPKGPVPFASGKLSCAWLSRPDPSRGS